MSFEVGQKVIANGDKTHFKTVSRVLPKAGGSPGGGEPKSDLVHVEWQEVDDKGEWKTVGEAYDGHCLEPAPEGIKSDHKPVKK